MCRVGFNAQRAQAQTCAHKHGVPEKLREIQLAIYQGTRVYLITNLHHGIIFAQCLDRPPTLQTENIFHRHTQVGVTNAL